MPRGRFKWLLAALVAMALVAAACGEGEEEVTPEAPEETPEETAAPSPSPSPEETVAIPEFTTLKEGVLTVGSCLDFPPFEAVEDGEEVGFDVELTEEIASRLGLEVEWVRADFDTIFTALAADQFDLVAAAVTITPERDEIVDFTQPYFNALQSLAVNVEERPDITSTADLGEGDVVGAQRGTTGLAWARENLRPQGVEIQTFQQISDAFLALEAGDIDGVINDEPSSAEIAEGIPTVEVVEAIDTDENYGLVTSPSNPALLEAVNIVLAEIIADGTYAQIFEKWFPGAELPAEFQPAA